jgi:peroxiredoxin
MRILRMTTMMLLFSAGSMLGAGSGGQEYEKAPSFTLKDLAGKDVELSDLLATGPVYMEFWDRSCANCIAELDALVPVYDTLKERGLQMVALSVDKAADEARVKAFFKGKKWPYVCLLDQQNEVKRAYGIIIKPAAYLINQQSEIVYTHIGYKKGDENRIKAEILRWLPFEENDSVPDAESPDGDR